VARLDQPCSGDMWACWSRSSTLAVFVVPHLLAVRPNRPENRHVGPVIKLRTVSRRPWNFAGQAISPGLFEGRMQIVPLNHPCGRPKGFTRAETGQYGVDSLRPGFAELVRGCDWEHGGTTSLFRG
jgi:hypothetical protein